MTDRYWGQGGNNSNDGLSYANRKLTFANVKLGIVAGDTVYMCCSAAGLGSRWTNSEQMVLVGGSVGNIVTYKVYPGHYVLSEVSTTAIAAPYWEDAAVTATGQDYWILEPGEGFLELGDASDWDPVSPSNGQSNFASRRQINAFNCTHFELIGTGTGDLTTSDSNFKIHGGRAWIMNFIDGECEDYRISGVDFSKGGTNNTGTNPENPDSDQGDLIIFGGLRSLIERNTFQYGGHTNARFSGRYQIVRDNWFDGDWTGVTPNADAGRGAPIERSGQRCCGMYSGADTDEEETASPWGHFIYENNIFNKAGSAGDDHDNCATEVNGYHVIVRQNYVWDGCNDTFRSATFESLHHCGLIKIYNNTCYGNGRVADLRHITELTAGYAQCDFLNNIFDEMQGSYFGVASVKHWRRNATLEDAEGFPNGWKGSRYSANITKMAAGSPDGTNVTVEFRTLAGATENYTVLTVDNAYPSNWSSNNVMGTSPTYLGNPAAGTRTRNTFLPNGGIETGNADPHAIANGAGSLSTSLTVDDGQARMFKDDWDMSDLGIEADWIKIGSADPVQISSIDYDTDVITLVHSRTWSDNAEVYWCTTDDGVNFTIFQDIGAGQTAGTVVPAPDPDAPIHSTKVMVFR